MSTPPAYSAEEARMRETFLALMWSFSYPGRVHHLPTAAADAFAAIADTLLDLETSYFCPDAALAVTLAGTGARSLPPEQAAYHFYPALDHAALAFITRANVGTLTYPDQGATLIIGAALNSGPVYPLQGPGIAPDRVQTLQVGGMDAAWAAFWKARSAANRYPLGWDIYLVDGSQVVGLPRTTHLILED